jgi:hypothetical protein
MDAMQFLHSTGVCRIVVIVKIRHVAHTSTLDVPHKKVKIQFPAFLGEQRFSQFGTMYIGNKQNGTLNLTQKYVWLGDDSFNIFQEFCSWTMHSLLASILASSGF